jgi:hypothetical protein
VEVCSACGQGIDRTARSPIWVALLMTAIPVSLLLGLAVVFRGTDRIVMAFIAGAAAWHCFTLWRGNYKVRPARPVIGSPLD